MLFFCGSCTSSRGCDCSDDAAADKYLLPWDPAGNGAKQFYCDQFHGYGAFMSMKNRQPERSLLFAKLLGAAMQKRGFEFARHHNEPIQGENGVVVPPAGYLQAARRITSQHGALLWIDEIQTGIGRTGTWFAFEPEGITPDIVTVAKGLGAGIPIGACIGLGAAADLLQPGNHGTTFGGNPVASIAGLAVLTVIERDGLLAQVNAVGNHLASSVIALDHPLIAGVRGRGMLLAIELTQPVGAD